MPRKRLAVCAIFLALLGSGYLVWASNSFQKTFSPERFWKTEEESAERCIEFCDALIIQASLLLSRIENDADAYLEERLVGALAEEKNIPSAISRSIEDLENSVQSIADLIDKASDMRTYCSKKLATAQHQLGSFSVPAKERAVTLVPMKPHPTE